MECTNNRTDQYGGSLENRLRFAKEILEAIKGECGQDFPVMVRYSVRSMMKGFNKGAIPGEDFVEFGRGIEESAKVAKMLQDIGYDALDADNGTYDSWWWAHPPVYMPEACNLDDCKYIKQFVDIPVICAGRMEDPNIGEEAIANGDIDAVGLARPLLADPEWANKVQSGHAEEIRPCISCHVGCLGRLFQAKDMCCALNPAVCREKEYELKPYAISTPVNPPPPMPPPANANMLKAIIEYYKIQVHLGANITKIGDHNIEFTVKDEVKSLDADTIITSIGYVSNKALYDAIKEKGIETHIIGDSNKVSNLLGAIWDGYELAMTL